MPRIGCDSSPSGRKLEVRASCLLNSRNKSWESRGMISERATEEELLENEARHKVNH